MEPDLKINGAAAGASASDGAPSPSPPSKSAAKKARKAQAKAEKVSSKTSTNSDQGAASPAPAKPPTPSAGAQASDKSKPEVKKEGQGEGQAQGDGGQGQQKSKAELKAERRALQEAQRAAKTSKKTEGTTQAVTKPEAKRVPSKVLQDDPSQERKVEKKLQKQNLPQRSSSKKKVALFNHLHQYERDYKQLSDMLMQVQTMDWCINDLVVELGWKYANYITLGSNARAIGLLQAFDHVISRYRTPKDKDLCRDLEGPIKRLITFIGQCRQLSVSMGNVIKFLKFKISQIPPDMPEAEAKEELRGSIRRFLKEKIVKASQAVSLYATQQVKEGEVIIVYAYSTVIYQVLVNAAKEKNISVMIVDNRPRHEGKRMLSELTKLGIPCNLVNLNMAASYIRMIKFGSSMGQVRSAGLHGCKLLIGAHGVFSNGCIMSRIGTAMLAALAKAHNIHVMACFETYKISERSQVDSIVFNELGDANELVELGHSDPVLSEWKEHKDLDLLNLMYDVTPSSLVTAYVTEIGTIPACTIPKVMHSRVSLYET